MPTKDELRTFQSLSLDMKIAKTKLRIREWVGYYGVGGVHVSFSGGKDSTVLLHIVRSIYPDVEAVFVDTGLEYPEVRAHVKTFDNVKIIRPKMRFDEVIRKYGYPFISKEVAQAIHEGRRSLALGTDSVKLKKIQGRMPPMDNGERSMFNHEKYEPLLHTDFLVSHYCCKVMKKAPMDTYDRETGTVPIVATMTEESLLREEMWCRRGCNAFEGKHPRSAPMSFWTEQDVLLYIKENGLPLASVYGDIVYRGRDGLNYENTLLGEGTLCTTKCQRTGCIFCGFGAHIEKGESRFERLKRTHPRQYEYCMEGGAYDADGLWKPTKEGLGMRHVIEAMNGLFGRGFIRY